MFNNIVSDFDFEEYAELHDILHEVKQVGEIRDDLKAYAKGGFFAKGQKLPWGKTFSQIELRPSELSLWGGSTGHGKSLMIGQVVLSLLKQNQKCLIASFEMPPVATLFRMVRQASGTKFPSDIAIDRFANWGNDNLYIYKHTGMVDANKVSALCRYAFEALKIQHLIIDNLNSENFLYLFNYLK